MAMCAYCGHTQWYHLASKVYCSRCERERAVPAFYSTKDFSAVELDVNKRFLHDSMNHKLLVTLFPQQNGWTDFDELILKYFESSRDLSELKKRLHKASYDTRCYFYIDDAQLNEV